MKPRFKLKRFVEGVEGEPGVAGCEAAEGRLGDGAETRAADEEAGERDDEFAAAKDGTADTGGVPAGDTLLLDEAEPFDGCWACKWRGSESAGPDGEVASMSATPAAACAQLEVLQSCPGVV